MRIAQVAPLTEAIPPKLYGGTERVVHWITEELVALGHDVTLYASGDSCTSAKLEPFWPRALRPMAGIGASQLTGMPIWDSVAGVGISCLLGSVGFYLARLNQQYLLGQAVESGMERATLLQWRSFLTCGCARRYHRGYSPYFARSASD